MPRIRGDKEYRLPIKGLNTEVNVLDFPQEFAVDINNMVLEFDPVRMKPRLGHTAITTSGQGNDFLGGTGNSGHVVLSYHLWEQAGDDEFSNFIAIQIGAKLTFINADSTNVTDIPATNYLNLADVLSGTSKGTGSVMEGQALQYTVAKGNLIITSEAIDPTLVRYDPTAGTFSFDKMTLKVRDTLGLESGIEIDKRPTAIGNFPTGAIASTPFPAISEDHLYNLYNQGWHQFRRLTSGSKTTSNPITEFFTQNSEYPSNADIVYVGMVDSSGDLIFDAELLRDQTFGSSPAARGHFVLDAFVGDRATPLAFPFNSGSSTGGGGFFGGGFDFGTIPGSIG